MRDRFARTVMVEAVTALLRDGRIDRAPHFAGGRFFVGWYKVCYCDDDQEDRAPVVVRRRGVGHSLSRHGH
jgi:hypothetical protein